MSIGRVLNTAFGAIFGNLFVMLGIAFLFSGLPQGVITYAQQFVVAQAGTGVLRPQDILGVFGVGLVIMMLLAFLMQGALVRATITSSQGEKASLGDCLATAGRSLLPLLGLGIISGLALGIAFLLLIVPGVFLSLMWYVAAPVVVAERSGVFASFGRSAELTEGQRWPIFLVLIIAVAIVFVVAMFGAAVSGFVAVATGMAGGGIGGPNLAVAAVNAISSTITAVVMGAIPTAVYVELRALKEGPSQGLDEIFA